MVTLWPVAAVPASSGEADVDVRDAFPECVDVQVIRPEADPGAGASIDPAPSDRTGLEPAALFADYLAQTRGSVDEALLALFMELVEEQVS